MLQHLTKANHRFLMILIQNPEISGERFPEIYQNLNQ